VICLSVPIWVWVATVVGLTGIIVADLAIVGRHPRAVSIKEASGWAGFYVLLAGLFAVGVWLLGGAESGTQFIAGYVTEYSLSVDNLFVFVLILSRFAVPDIYQHKVLFIGIALSLAMRGVCIAAGAAAIAAFSWTFYIFGALLLYTAVRLVLDKDEEAPDYNDTRMVRLLRRVVPTSDAYDGSRMTTRVNGRLLLTPMVIVVSVIAVANVVFALDSIPAVFGLTSDAYIVFTANAFALMGLRQLYFLVGGLLDRLVYLSYGLAVILAFIGVKLVLEALEGSGVGTIEGVHLPHIGTAVSLGVIVVTLALTAAASLLRERLGSNA